MKSGLLEIETWAVQDSTKVQSYMVCPRQYFFEYVLGWKIDRPNVHLVYGTAVHYAMEILMERGYDEQARQDALAVMEDYYAEHIPPDMWDHYAPKDPINARRGLELYAQHYREDDFKVLHIEVAGSVAISETSDIYFKTDTICQDHRGYFSLEHKTSGRFSKTWADQWRLKFQSGTYNHVLYCLYPEEAVYGVLINGLFPHKEPRLKKNGEPYANERDWEFHRVSVRRNRDSMQAWLIEANYWMGAIEQDFQRLADVAEEDKHMLAFLRNTESCTRYGLCPYYDHCTLWHNPLQHCTEPPIGFILEHWDPRTIETVRETINL